MITQSIHPPLPRIMSICMDSDLFGRQDRLASIHGNALMQIQVPLVLFTHRTPG